MLVKLFTTSSVTGERCVNVGSKSVRRLKLFGFQGSWVERDFTQLVTAVFQGICEANPDWKCVGLQLLRPVLHWWNVDSSNFSKLTDNTENGQRNSPLPSAPIRTTDSNRRCGRVRWPVHVPGWWKLTLIWWCSPDLANRRTVAEGEKLSLSRQWFVDFPNYQFHFWWPGVNILLLWREHYYCIVPVETVVNIICPVDFSEYSVN